MLTEIASRRDDGNPPMRIGEINALLITPGGLNPPGKDLFIRFVLNIKKTGLKYYLFGRDVTIDVNSCAEKECIRVIDNFRKAGLPPEFTKLCVTADLPEDYRSSNFKTYGEKTFCAYVISREELVNGSPPRQTFKNFQTIQ